jgi:hypothetical protein
MRPWFYRPTQPATAKLEIEAARPGPAAAQLGLDGGDDALGKSVVEGGAGAPAARPDAGVGEALSTIPEMTTT